MTMDKQLASHHANAPSPTAKVFSAAFYGLSSLGTYVEHASACFGGGGCAVRSDDFTNRLTARPPVLRTHVYT